MIKRIDELDKRAVSKEFELRAREHQKLHQKLVLANNEYE
jgi:hypothetical protein